MTQKNTKRDHYTWDTQFRSYVSKQMDNAKFEARVDALTIGKAKRSEASDLEFEKQIMAMSINNRGDPYAA